MPGLKSILRSYFELCVFSPEFHLFSPNKPQGTRFEDSITVTISDTAHSGGCGLFLCATPAKPSYDIFCVSHPHPQITYNLKTERDGSSETSFSEWLPHFCEIFTKKFTRLYFWNEHLTLLNPLAPNDIYIYICIYIHIYMSYRTANLQTLHFKYLLNNTLTEHFKHAAHSPFFLFKMPFIS